MLIRKISLRSGEIKALKKQLESTLPEVAKLLSEKSVVEQLEYEDGDRLYLIDKEPVLVDQKSGMHPALAALLKGTVSLPQAVVDMGAVPHIANGADAMAPGLVAVDESLKLGDLAVIVDERHGKPLAVAQLIMPREKIFAEKKGKALKVIHYVGDRFWKAV